MLPALEMPTYGALRETVPKDFGWTGEPGSSAGMHNVDLGTEIVFAVPAMGGDCFAGTAASVPTMIAGFAGQYVEPYGKDAPRFLSTAPATTGAYALAIADRTLCIYLSWGASTSPAELEAARQVLAALRAQPFGESGIRIVFTTLGWDNG